MSPRLKDKEPFLYPDAIMLVTFLSLGNKYFVFSFNYSKFVIWI